MHALQATAEQLDTSTIVNIASVPQRSPFRYPGGKTWLIPRVRRWLTSKRQKPEWLMEPFAGGAIVSLTAVFDDLVGKALINELDHDIASVWRTMLSDDAEWLSEQISGFHLTPDSVRAILQRTPLNDRERAFATLLRNRISRGGILAPGAGIVKNGENGKGLSSRWYPETLCKRIRRIGEMKKRLFVLGVDGTDLLRRNSWRRDAVFFIDPPYVIAGRRLYRHADIDHGELFRVVAGLTGDFLMTYDSTAEIKSLAHQYGLEVCEVLMKTTHHTVKKELLISRDLAWLGSNGNSG